MKKPTVEELEKLIFGMLITGRGAKEVAEEIHALYNPPLKPLSELHNDEEAIKEIASMFAVYYDRAECTPDTTRIFGGFDDHLAVISIWNDGEIFFSLDGEDESIGNVFFIVDKIRELGYDFKK